MKDPPPPDEPTPAAGSWQSSQHYPPPPTPPTCSVGSSVKKENDCHRFTTTPAPAPSASFSTPPPLTIEPTTINNNNNTNNNTRRSTINDYYNDCGVSNELPFYHRHQNNNKQLNSTTTTTNSTTSNRNRIYSKPSRRIIRSKATTHTNRSSYHHSIDNSYHYSNRYYGRLLLPLIAAALAIGGIWSSTTGTTTTDSILGGGRGWNGMDSSDNTNALLDEYPHDYPHHHRDDAISNRKSTSSSSSTILKKTIRLERNLRTTISDSIDDSTHNNKIYKINNNNNNQQTTTSTTTPTPIIPSPTPTTPTQTPTNKSCPPPPPTPPLPKSLSDTLHPAIAYTIIFILILASAFFSGLTLGLMGLDTVQLEIVMSGDDVKLSKAAAAILPVRRKANLLLCTLLLGNVAVNTLLGILLADFAGGTLGFLISTALIVIFGEIIPQALFSRYALQVGEKAVPTVKVVILLLYVIAKPMAFCLDKLLGHELGTTYSKAEMSKLLEIHVKEGRFSEETGIAMAGALKYQDVAVKDVMTPLENTFMINVEDKLNFDTMSKIFKTGYSRIPIYEVDVQNVIGLLFTKDLIFIDPDDETPVKKFWEIFGRGPHLVWPDDKLGDVLRHLKKGHTHMALVRGTNTSISDDLDPTYQLYGIVTLEDIIEEIIGEEILDETDAWVDGNHSKRVLRSGDDDMDNDDDDDDMNNNPTVRKGFDWARLRLLDDNIVDQKLSEEEVRAVGAHLRTNYSHAVEALSARQLPRMIAATPVVELPLAPTRELGQLVPTSTNLLYEKGVVSDVCTLILGGKVTVVAGVDNFRSDVSSWTVLGAGALGGGKNGEGYVPDFSAYVSGSGPCRCLRFSRKIFGAAADASVLEGSVVGCLVSSKRGGSGNGASTLTPKRGSKRGVSLGGGSCCGGGDDDDLTLVLSEDTDIITDFATNPATTAVLTGDDTSLPIVSIHDELSAGAGDAEEDVRERRAKLLEIVLLEKTAISTTEDTKG